MSGVDLVGALAEAILEAATAGASYCPGEQWRRRAAEYLLHNFEIKPRPRPGVTEDVVIRDFLGLGDLVRVRAGTGLEGLAARDQARTVDGGGDEHG